MKKIVLTIMLSLLCIFGGVSSSTSKALDKTKKPPVAYDWKPVMIACPESFLLFVYFERKDIKLKNPKYCRAVAIYECKEGFQLVGSVYTRKFIPRSEILDFLILRVSI